MSASKASRLGEEIWKTRIEKVNAELVVLTYGTIVAQICKDFENDYVEVGFKIFLNVTPTITNWTSDNKQFSLIFDENPLADFVELPDDGRAQDELWFSNILCGVLRGALEMVQMQVETHFISDVLRGNDTTEMRVTLVRYIDDELPPEDD
ncbi:unnamed protein product [Sordaria macrospora k-hell]|uniref:Trafficking protein particle complex subunit BET3 n=1 Tax=Sordaria macrospora (strain ATCC MYA-333 / DSM 997 / K(L3346) / K-hell) TaxID=771870 RepID=F7W5L9_SORMK|nr:uncharacterized protein SMAC_07650 [Sordaria macrospora k-hell]CCC12807.1 unnamed protein product [Sordaria macrospora k-hell]